MTSCPRCGGAQQERLVRVQRRIVLGLYIAGFALAWLWGGAVLHDLAEGVQRSLLPVWKAIVPAVVLITATVAQFGRFRERVCVKCEEAVPAWLLTPLTADRSVAALAGPTRRKVLRVIGGVGTGVAATAGGVAVAVGRNRGWLPVAHDFFMTQVENIAPQARPEWKEASIRSYRRLGRTNAMVSDISLGSGRINDAQVARYAIERGITYFDTAPDYSDNLSERVLGEAMKGHRDKLFLATKFCVRDGHLPNDTSVPKIIEAVEGSLQRLQTDHVDLIHIHSCDRVERLLAPNIHEAFDRLKEQGKVRFLGVSTHTPNLEEVANTAIDSGRFDVMMLAYHFGMWPSFGHILEKAKAHDVGIVAMKTLKGAKHTNLADFRKEADSYAQAAFRWVLSNPAVACLVISIYEQRQVDEYVFASGTAVRPTDVALLQRYDQLVSGDYCQPHCGACLDSCAYDLPINDVLRYRMYFKDYHWESEGKRLYAKLDRNASACVDCAAPCANTCPIGVPIQEKMLDAHRWLKV
ncbi:MAG TPA: aldo/keto reductase [Candidatus Acidoferrales bacterium]|nr:aldo/keto reductase [Candidatus Acidoferrales bacterium]